MIILLHSSKTMRNPVGSGDLHQPALLDGARQLVQYIRRLTIAELSQAMHVSSALAETVHAMYTAWDDIPAHQSAAMDSFVGDIYSGLRATELSLEERIYADQHLRILSGLYGILRPLDGIRPYRLEMGYHLPAQQYRNLYAFWGKQIAQYVPEGQVILNLAAVEYSKAVTPYVDGRTVVTPKFLTINPATQQPVFVVVHAKIARGAFARWAIQHRVDDISRLAEFAEIGYRYDAAASTPLEPVFVCQEFGGKGLSMRLAQ